MSGDVRSPTGGGNYHTYISMSNDFSKNRGPSNTMPSDGPSNEHKKRPLSGFSKGNSSSNKRGSLHSSTDSSKKASQDGPPNSKDKSSKEGQPEIIYNEDGEISAEVFTKLSKKQMKKALAN